MKLSDLCGGSSGGATGFYNSEVKESASDITLTEDDAYKIIYINFTAADKKIILPNATTLEKGLVFILNFVNREYFNQIVFHSGLIASGKFSYYDTVDCILIDNSFSNGEWLFESTDEQDENRFKGTRGYVSGGTYQDWKSTGINHEYTAFTNSWASRPGFSGFYGGGSSTIDLCEYIYSGMGNGSSSYHNTCSGYNPFTNSTFGISGYPSPDRAYFSASTIDEKGCIYGGNDENQAAYPYCNKYTRYSNSWSNMSNLPQNRAGTAASTINDKGYVYCGFDDDYNSYRTCFEFSLTSGWTTKTDAPSPNRSYIAASTISGKGYIYSGDCDEFTPTTNSWTSKANLPSPSRSSLSAATIDIKSYVFCGRSGSTYLLDCDEFTPTTNSWTSKPDVPPPARYFTASTSI